LTFAAVEKAFEAVVESAKAKVRSGLRKGNKC